MLKPAISIIICNHVDGELFWKTIDSVKKQIGVFEIIIPTSSKEVFKKGVPGCKVFFSDATPAEKRNIGAERAQGQFLAFFDDDVELDENCLQELLKPMNDKIAMTYGKLWNMEHRDRFDEAGGYLTSTGFIWSRAQQNDKDVGQYDKAEPILAGKSASCMVRKDVFDEVGGFDEDFGILGEETDLSWRIWLKGYEVWYAPKATGYHAFNTKFKPVNRHYTTARVQYNGCRNYITMLVKNLETKNLWKILPIHTAIWFTASIAMITTGKIIQGWNILKGLGYVVLNVPLLRRKRKLVQKGRKVNDRTLFTYIFRRASRGYYTQRFRRYIVQLLHG